VLAFSALLRFGVQPWFVLAIAALIYLNPMSSLIPWDAYYEMQTYAIYVAAGLVVASYKDPQSFSDSSATRLMLLIGLGTLISSLGGQPTLPERHELEPILAVGGITAIAALAILTNNTNVGSAIRLLGRHSLEIYVAHTIASAAIRIALANVAHITNPAIHLILGTLFGLYFPMALVLIFHRAGLTCYFQGRCPT
jgi:uncharacterized membrane protein YcfT